MMKNITLLVKPASSLCNMRCKYCFYADVSSHRDIKSFGIMNEDTLSRMVRRAFAIAEESVSFGFQGGEPTVAGLEWFKKLISYEKQYNSKGLRVSNALQTNGYLIDEEWCKFLHDNNFLVGLSLDGYKELHDSMRVDAAGEGTYDRVIKSAELFKKYNVEFNILTVVNSETAKEPERVYDALSKYGYIQFIPMIDDFDAPKSKYYLDDEAYGEFLCRVFDRYYKDIKRGSYVSVRDFDSFVLMLRGQPPTSCALSGSCGGYFVIEADGGVYPCDFYVTDEEKVGNINEDSFFSLVKKPKAVDFITSSRNKEEECPGCKWFYLCRGGCRRYREPYPSKFKFCGAFKKFFEYSYPRLTEIAKMR